MTGLAERIDALGPWVPDQRVDVPGGGAALR